MAEEPVSNNQNQAQVSSNVLPSSFVTPEPDHIIKARAERESLQKENERLEKNLRELREIEARNILGGRSEAGFAPKQLTKEEEYANEAKMFAKRAGIELKKYAI